MSATIIFFTDPFGNSKKRMDWLREEFGKDLVTNRDIIARGEKVAEEAGLENFTFVITENPVRIANILGLACCNLEKVFEIPY